MNAMDIRRRILVADDDPIFLDLFEAALPSDLYDIVAVGDGAAAMLRLEAGRFDLAVIDIQMPKIDGLRLIALIRSTPGLRNLPIVVITSIKEDRMREDCLQTGANDYLTKPVDWRLLPARLERLTGGSAACSLKLVAPSCHEVSVMPSSRS